MSKEIMWGSRYGEGEIVATCDNCGKEETAQAFEDCCYDFKEASQNLCAYGWVTKNISGEFYDFCGIECRDEYIAELEANAEE